MYTYYDFRLVRELLLLLVFCLFVIYAVLTGMAQDRKAKRDAKRMTEQDAPPSVCPETAGSGANRAAELHARIEDRIDSGSARLAA